MAQSMSATPALADMLPGTDLPALFQLPTSLADGKLTGRRIVVAMSGGVDSSVVAALAVSPSSFTITARR